MSPGPARAGAVALSLATLLGGAACGVKALPRPPLGPPAARAPPAAPSPGGPAVDPPACEDCAAPRGAPDPEE